MVCRMAVVFAASLVSMPASCQQVAPGDTKEQQAQVLIKVNDIDVRVKEIQEYLHIAPQSPLKVRGGSMTAFTTAFGGWKQTSKGFCIQIDDAKYIEIHHVPLQGVVVPFKIDIYGHVPVDSPSAHRGDPSSNGIELQGSSSDCSGLNTGASISLSTFGSSDFYPNDLPNVGKTGNKRFWDKSEDCKGEPKPGGNGDREFCERMAEIDIFYSTSTTSPTFSKIPNYKMSIPDGDEEVAVGSPR